MNKIEKAEEFLKLISEIAKNEIIIDSNLVYSNLIVQGARKDNINDYFDSWISRFKNNRNTNVFVQDNWRYFCQFISKNDNYHNNSKIKMYVPLDKNHIYEGANKLFDFMSANNISHHSKIGSEIRLDDIVIRLDSKNDAKKISDFVKNNSYIKEGMIDPSPFALIQDRIGYAWDGSLSYNTVVSEWISDYVNSLKHDNRLPYVSYTGFYSYINEKYNEVFLKGIGINDFIKSKNTYNMDEVTALENYHNVTRLLLMSLNPHTELDDLYNSIRIFDDREYSSELNKRFAKFVSIDKKENISNENIETIDYIYEELSKLKSEEETVRIFRNFGVTGNYRFFTRSNNIRDIMICNGITKEMVQKRFVDYQKDSLMNASVETTIKYGMSQTKAALISAKMGDYKMFTNTNRVRDELSLLVDHNELDRIITLILKDKGMEANNLNESYEMFSRVVSENLRRVK